MENKGCETIKGKKGLELKCNLMRDNPFDGDPIEDYYETVSTVEDANSFLDDSDGGIVYWNGKTVGYSWGDIKYVKLDKNGYPIILDD